VASYAKINRDLDRLSTWANKWLVTCNAKKTVYIMISRKTNPGPRPILKLDGVRIKEVLTHKHLGLTFNQTLTWSDHIGNLSMKAAKCVGLLRRICRDVPRECLEILYKSMIRPLLEYGDVIFDGSSDTNVKRLEDVQCQAALTCTGAYKHTKHTVLLDELGWPPLALRRKHHRMSIMFKIQKGLIPQYLIMACPPLTRDRTIYNLHSGLDITTFQTRTTTYQKSFFPQSVKDWNGLDKTLRAINTFKDHQKKNAGYKTNKLFHHRSNAPAINHTRIRLGLSGLSSQRFDYKHIDDPKCIRCGAKREDPIHYFLLCPAYTEQRQNSLNDICDILHSNDIAVEFNRGNFRKFVIKTILRGSILLDDVENKNIFLITQLYILNTKRFP
jgi:hypothetical protein